MTNNTIAANSAISLATYPNLKIRSWEPRDLVQLLPMITEFLQVGHARGGSLLPTRKNALVLYELGIYGAEMGDPCLVLTDLNQIIAYIEWCCPASVSSFDLAYKTLHTWGAYTLPKWRKKGVSDILRRRGLEMARELGYECVTGPVHTTNERGIQYFCEEGAWPTSIQFEYLL